MLNESKDILFIVIAICVAVFTFFISWALYYVVMMLKRAHIMIKEISDFIAGLKEKLDRVENLLKTIEEKIKNSASYLPLVMKGVTELIDYVKRKKEQKTKRKENKK